MEGTTGPSSFHHLFNCQQFYTKLVGEVETLTRVGEIHMYSSVQIIMIIQIWLKKVFGLDGGLGSFQSCLSYQGKFPFQNKTFNFYIGKNEFAE